MKIFEDRKLTKEIKLIHFGEVKAGSSKEKTVYLLNDSNAILRKLKFHFPNAKKEKIKVVLAPVKLKFNESGKVILKWSPSLNFKRALNVEMKVEGEEVYLAR